jgi:hypothetical protein
MSGLSGVMPYLIGAAMAATLLVLVVGLIAMLRGGDFNRRHGNRLMRMRILFQAIAVLLFVVFALMMRN